MDMVSVGFLTHSFLSMTLAFSGIYVCLILASRTSFYLPCAGPALRTRQCKVEDGSTDYSFASVVARM